MTGIVDALYKRILLAAHPVGCIYQSLDATSPAAIFGGTWEQIKGRFLFGTGLNEANTTNEYGNIPANWINRSAGELGGEIEHTLTTFEMPSHAHKFNANVYGNATGGSYTGFVYTSNGSMDWGLPATAYTGGGNAHNNMPPYMVVYMWKRVS